MRRLSPAFANTVVHYVSTSKDLARDVAPASLSTVPDANLDSKLKALWLAFRVLILIIKLRPSVVLSTGAAPGFFAIMFGKLLGARTIWVDSIANADKLSVSGEKVKPFADLWLTQWPHLETPRGPFYRGSVV
jgi:hypothetical protein